MASNPDPRLQPVDSEAIALARSLLRTARYGALATLDPQSGHPLASRTATATDTDGTPVILVSALAPHTSALKADPRCSLLIGEPGKGDPLAHPRMTIVCDAAELVRDSEDGRRARRRYLNRHPKAALYADFGDFAFFRLDILSASLNGGFARAYALDRRHLLLASEISRAVAAAEQSAIDHMNMDHADAIRLIASDGRNKGNSDWKLTGIDPEGIDLANGDMVRRITFQAPLAAEADLRIAFKALLDTIRGIGS